MLTRLCALLPVIVSVFLATEVHAQPSSASRYKAGQSVEVLWGNKWWPAKVIAPQSRGGARISYDGYGENWDEDVPADRIRPTGKAGTPAAPKKTTAQVRTWTDASGKFKVQAQFVKLDGQQVELLRTDGKTAKIPLDNLSSDDQAYVKKQLADADPENPFKAEDIPEGAAKSESNNSAARNSRDPFPKVGHGVSRRPWEQPDQQAQALPSADESKLKISPVHSTAAKELILDPTNRFTYVVDPATPSPSLDGVNRAFDLVHLPREEAGPLANFDHVKSLTFDAVGQQVIVAFMKEAPQQERKSRIQRLNLMNGESIAINELPANFVPIDFDSQAKRILGRSDNYESGTRNRLDIWQLGPDGLTHHLSFKPYVSATGGSPDDVIWAKFVGANHIATLGGDNQFIVWETKSLRQVYAVKLKDYCLPALSGSGAFVAIVRQDGAWVLESTSGKVAARLPGSLGYNPKLMFRPDGKQLACVTNSQLTIWDLTATGQTTHEIVLPHSQQAETLMWPNDDSLVIKYGETLRLVDLQKRIVLWTYKAGEVTQCFAGHLWSVVDGLGGGKSLIHVEMPDEEARQMKASLANTDTVPFKPGATVSVFINVGLPEPDRVKIYKHLIGQLQALGIKIDQNSPLSIEASTAPGKTETVSYRPFLPSAGGGGEVQVTNTISRLTLRENGKVLWEQVHSTRAPFSIDQKQGQSLQQTISELTSPNAEYFLSISLPREVARYPESNTYGSSTLGVRSMK